MSRDDFGFITLCTAIALALLFTGYGIDSIPVFAAGALIGAASLSISVASLIYGPWKEER